MKGIKRIKLEIKEIQEEIIKWQKDLDTAKKDQLLTGSVTDFIFIKGCEELIQVLYAKILALKWVLEK
jgi:hypothetical protein